MTGPESGSGTSGVEPVLVSAYEGFAKSKARGTDPAAGEAFDPATSPLHGKAVFVIGAPRSGTTWLQQLLLVHPAIAGAGEMHVFCEGVGAVFDNHEGDDAYSGLSGWVTRPELVGLVRHLVDGIMLRLRDTARPDATHVLDKTPNHVPYAARLAEVYPDATFVQIIRDGRDSAASAHDLWSWSSDYSAHGGNAARWRDAVLDCRRHLSGLRYVEVRYEDLLADTVGGLATIYDLIGLPYDDAFLARSAEFGRTPLNLRPSRTDISSRKWADLPIDAEREIYLAAGDLLVELGYVDRARVDTVVAHRSLRRTTRDATALARKTAARAGRKLEQQRAARDPRRRRTAAVRRGARTIVEAVAAGQRAALEAALPSGVELVDGLELTSGAADVARRLVEVAGSGTMLRLEADHEAAAARWTGTPGGVELMRLLVDSRGRVQTIELTRVAPTA